MKYLVAVALWLSVVGWATGAELSGREMAKWQIAVRSGARQFEENLSDLACLKDDDRKRLVDELAATISAAPKAHRSRKESLAVSESVIAVWVARCYDELLAEAAVEASKHAGREVKRVDIVSRLPDDLRDVDSFMKNIPAEKALESFRQARERVVAMGRFNVDKYMSYPAEKDLNDQLAQLARKTKGGLEVEDVETLTDWIAGTVMPETSVQLEEVAEYARGAARRVLVDIMGQYDRQADALKEARGAVPKGLIKASDIEANLVEAVTTSVGSFPKPVMGGVRYNVFGVIKDDSRDAAAYLETRRFGAFVRQTDELDIPVDQVEKFMRSNLTLCRDPKVAKKHLVEYLFQPVRGRALETYGGGNAVDVAYFSQRFEGNDSWTKAVSKRIEEDVAEPMAKVRRIIASEQLMSSFPDLTEDRVLGEHTLLAAELRKLDPGQVDDMMAILELDGCRAVSQDERGVLFQECLDLATAWTRQRLELGKKALAAQRGIVDGVEAARKADLEKDAASGRKVEKIIAEWLKQARHEWSRAPAELVDAYPELFEVSLAMINKNVRQFYDAKRQEIVQGTPRREIVSASDNDGEPKARKEEEAPSAQPKEPEKTPVEQEKEAESEGDPKELAEKEKQSRDFLELAYSIDADPPDLQITMDQTEAGKCVMALTLPGTEQILARLEFDPAVIDNSSEQLADVLARPLAQVIAKEKEAKRGIWPFKFKDKTPEITLYMTIKSPDIRHVMNLRLREALQEKLGDDVVLRWRVGL